ncbi:MAG: toll/interleukin-1 receptor domain-containing protein [Caenispirillum sp.]|nr:toll/interleukin-1 receptor domain-containing protein [Caenispirillum sp.]
MLPPVLEVYVLWHPDDTKGADVADRLIEHFHAEAFSGLLGGAIDVYVRSIGWDGPGTQPRPIPLPNETHLTPAPARFVAIVPLLGPALSREVATSGSPWNQYLDHLVRAAETVHVPAVAGKPAQKAIAIFPVTLHADALHGALGQFFGSRQILAAADPSAPEPEPEGSMLRRDLTQGLAQFLADAKDKDRIHVFISHTKRWDKTAERQTQELIATILEVIDRTRLGKFFDANSIQPGKEWEQALETAARTCALLAVRTDLYAGRNWCQREVMLAKQAGVPVVTLDALDEGEARGSYMLDHVPRLRARHKDEKWDRADIRRALGVLVDESLKRELWSHQRDIARAEGVDPPVAWWAPHAPEPMTFAHWLRADSDGQKAMTDKGVPLILHPDPPLTETEREDLLNMATLLGLKGVDPMTPRTLAARGGGSAS